MKIGIEKDFSIHGEWWVFVIVSTHLWVKRVKKNTLGVRKNTWISRSDWNWFFFRLYTNILGLKLGRNSWNVIIVSFKFTLSDPYRWEEAFFKICGELSFMLLQNSKEIPCFYMECWGNRVGIGVGRCSTQGGKKTEQIFHLFIEQD